ncbi:rod-determining factor RdfA [Halorussus salinisoli]|uniref:rod-determining factor RdfA n=1 Tax=Halorussus salinisoli TaxID=2558242 RepID=UPI0010C1990D|nr:rod-determining factor RdfA [Halorussus salinisoli]
MRQSKVEKALEEYDLSGVGDQLEDYWLGTGNEQYSLRELESWFNEQILRAALEEASTNPLDGEVENIYRLLSEDEVSSGMRSQARNRLERSGIEVEKLEDDFVSYQSIRTYLTNHRNVSAPTDDTSNLPEREVENIQRLKSRLSTVTESKLRRLQDAGEIQIDSLQVLADLRVFCETCGSRYSVEELLKHGHCNCESS